MHLIFELYLLVLKGELPPTVLVKAAHEHLLELCPSCVDEWNTYRRAHSSCLPIMKAPANSLRDPEGQVRHRSISGSAVRSTESTLAKVRQEQRKARQDLSSLLKLEPTEWADRVQRAQTRFRSRAFAELLLAESRRRVRNEPDLGHRLATLVHVVLHWIPQAEDQDWALPLKIRAQAQEANAHRVAGRISDAEACFSTIRQELSRNPLNDLVTHGEVCSVEASLRIDQRRFTDATRLLDLATVLYRFAGESTKVAGVLIQRANTERHLGDNSSSIATLQEAAALIDADAEPFLFLCTVTSRVLCLCDLDRADEAWDLLHRHLDLYEASDDPWVRVSVQDLRGRVLLGLKCHEEAAEAFAACRDGALELGRDYDAALASLDLALVYLEQGRTAELRRLAGELVPTFQARGVDREALAALRLVQQAVAAEELTRSVLADVRERLRRVKG